MLVFLTAPPDKVGDEKVYTGINPIIPVSILPEGFCPSKLKPPSPPFAVSGWKY